MNEVFSTPKSASSVGDLSQDADLSIGVMNLISLEEHLSFSYSKTRDEKYLHVLSAIRKMRKELLHKLVPNPQGEEWCISKHLLATSMRLYEVGTKSLDAGKKEEAASLFAMGFEAYSLFFGLKLGMKTSPSSPSAFLPEEVIVPLSIPRDTTSFVSRVKEAVQKMVDCCKE